MVPKKVGNPSNDGLGLVGADSTLYYRRRLSYIQECPNRSWMCLHLVNTFQTPVTP